MTTRNKTNEGIAHRMVRCVGRAVKSFLDSDPKIRNLKYLNEILKEKNELMQEETKQLRKVHDYLRKEVKAGRLIYRRAANATAAAAPTAAPAYALVSTVPVVNVVRSTNSSPAVLPKPIDRVHVRQGDDLIKMVEERRTRSSMLQEKRNMQHIFMKQCLENQIKARGLTYVPPANATIVDVLEEMADLLNAERQRSERCSQSRCRCGAVVDNSDLSEEALDAFVRSSHTFRVINYLSSKQHTAHGRMYHFHHCFRHACQKDFISL
mmetsp:Transcript_27697/g.60229  ORF Transcript_27697/g.60229 Transcript_27697/m.60229 type:complete len:266 (+) Transcript_27697:409-1206(+)